MDSTWANILWFLAIGGFFFMMMRRGGGCCGGHRHQDKPGKSSQADTKNPKDLTLESTPVDENSTDTLSKRSTV